MSRWKRRFGWAGLGLLAIFGLLVAAGFFDNRPDPEFEAQLARSSADNFNALVEAEAQRRGVSGVNIYHGDGAQAGTHSRLGRAKKGTVMQAASLSKAVAAAVILTMADTKGVSIDEDIRAQITSLDIASLEGGNRPVTLRQLLSHTAGSSQSGYPGYPRDSALPTSADIIADPPRVFEFPLVFDSEVGAFRYSGGGYMIAQLWAQDVSGQSFTRLAQETLLDPLGMEDSTFSQPIEQDLSAPGPVVGSDAGFNPLEATFASLDNSWHNYPEQAAAGLWTSARDYARFARALIDASRGEPGAIPAKVAQEMLAPQVETGWESGAQHYGLGLMHELDEGGSLTRFAHTGANIGYRAYFAAELGQDGAPPRIAVSMANKGNAAPLNRAIVHALMQRD